MRALLVAALLAYIPAPGALLRRAGDRGVGARAREITFTGTLELDGAAAAPARLVVKLPLQCRLERDGGEKVSVRGTADRPAATVDGNAGPALSLLKLACPLIAYRGLGGEAAARALTAVATQAGADVTSQTSLGRLVDRVVYVVGAGPRDTAKPQLWLYKDSNAPARLIAQGGDDVRLLEYGSPAAADWFPRVLELWQDGKRTARFEVVETKGLKGASEDEDDSAD